MTGTAPFFVHHTIRLSRTEVLEALRGAALARAHGALRLVAPASCGVELETRLLPGAVVEIDGAAIMIEGRLPEDLAALLRTAPAAAIPATTLVEAAEEVIEAEPGEEPLLVA